MTNDVGDNPDKCEQCLRRKALYAHIVNITAIQPDEMLFIDFCILEPDKDGITKYGQRWYYQVWTSFLMSERCLRACVTVHTQIDQFVAHYGFPARTHNDQSRQFKNTCAGTVESSLLTVPWGTKNRT